MEKARGALTQLADQRSTLGRATHTALAILSKMKPETLIGSEWAQGYGEALRNRWGFVLTTRRRKYFMMTTSAASAAQWMAHIQVRAEGVLGGWERRRGASLPLLALRIMRCERP